MRWLFFLLLVINLGILAWSIQQERISSARKVKLAPEVGDLRLLSESEIAAPASPEPSVVSTPTETDAATPQLAETDKAVAVGSIEEQSDTAVASIQEPQPVLETSDDEPASLSTDEPGQPEPQQQAEVSEEQVEEEAVESVSEVTPPEPVESCGVIGPVDDEALARRISRALERRGVQASLRRETIQKTVGFWVIIPPYESRQKAIAEVKRLNKEGITDVRRFYRGDLRNGISLGMFSRQRNAERHRREIAAKGFSPKVLPRTRGAEMSLIDYRVRGVNGEQDVTEAIAKYPDLEHQAQSCPQKTTQ